MGYTPQVVVIGGGIVGCAITRDLAIRGLDVTLVERETLASGTTAQADGVLASGAHLAVSDPATARRCIAENRTLFEIARHCIEDTGGLIVPASGTGQANTATADLEEIREATMSAGIPVTSLTGEEVADLEPALAESVDQALRVPSVVVDPFRLAIATAQDALEYGATIHTHSTVTDIEVDGGTIGELTVRSEPVPPIPDTRNGAPVDASDAADGESRSDTAASRAQAAAKSASKAYRGEKEFPGDSDRSQKGVRTAATRTIDADYVVNATGVDATQVVSQAGFRLPLDTTVDACLVTGDRPFYHVLTVPTVPTDTAVPVRTVGHGPNSLFCVPGVGSINENGQDDGTDEAEIDSEGLPASLTISTIDAAVDRFESLFPGVDSPRVLRAFPRHRYQVAGNDRPAAHGHDSILVDHANYHDCWGMTTVLGGSLTTHRYVAERVGDHVCAKFGIERPSRTAELSLPGSADEPFPGEPVDAETRAQACGVSPAVYEATAARHGGRTDAILATEEANPVLCECRAVTRAEVQAAMDDEMVEAADLEAVRHRTAAAMGECQGGRCAHRIAATLYPEYNVEVVDLALDHLLRRRFRGQRLATWGEQLQTVARNHWQFRDAFGTTRVAVEDLDWSAFERAEECTPPGYDREDRNLSGGFRAQRDVVSFQDEVSIPGDEAWRTRDGNADIEARDGDDVSRGRRPHWSLRGGQA